MSYDKTDIPFTKIQTEKGTNAMPNSRKKLSKIPPEIRYTYPPTPPVQEKYTVGFNPVWGDEIPRVNKHSSASKYTILDVANRVVTVLSSYQAAVNVIAVLNNVGDENLRPYSLVETGSI